MNSRLKGIEKRVISIFIILLALLYSFLCGCSSRKTQPTVQVAQGFSVNFIDVGNGDCIFIRFDDGKNMLIDCGFDDNENFNNISAVLDAYQTRKIDYLVLTHPDADHIGNIDKILAKYSVERAYLPKIENKTVYPKFDFAYNSLVSAGTQITYTNIYDSIVGENYFIAFLSPCASGGGDYYGYFNGLYSPTENDINDLSPVIYLEYKGIRFLFTGDASKRQEKAILQNYALNLYSQIHQREINLYDIDLLKVAHHGSDDSNCLEFLSVAKPKMAVVSVGGDNVYGLPSAEVLALLSELNASVKVLRTDVLGNITLSVDSNGNLKVNE